ncbi:MAG: hypothetical protein ACFFG0_41675 [Candidatus Thorarchaeota archaeon]
MRERKVLEEILTELKKINKNLESIIKKEPQDISSILELKEIDIKKVANKIHELQKKARARVY